MPTRLKYDGISQGKHTWIYGDDGEAPASIQRLQPGAIVEVADLNHPTSVRARQARIAIESGIAHVIEEVKAAVAPKPEPEPEATK